MRGFTVAYTREAPIGSTDATAGNPVLAPAAAAPAPEDALDV